MCLSCNTIANVGPAKRYDLQRGDPAIVASLDVKKLANMPLAAIIFWKNYA